MSSIINANDVELWTIPDLKESIKEIEHCLHYKPKFIIINASDNEANKRYIKAKVKMAEQLGLEAIVMEFGEEVTDEEIIRYITLCSDENIPLIVQLPIYSHLNKERIIFRGVHREQGLINRNSPESYLPISQTIGRSFT